MGKMNHVPGLQLWMGNLWKSYKRLRDVPEKITDKEYEYLSKEIIKLIDYVDQLVKE